MLRMRIEPRMLIAVLLVLVFASMPLPALAQKVWVFHSSMELAF